MFSWSQAPFIRILIPFLAGIILQVNFQFIYELIFYAITGICLLFLLIVTFIKPIKKYSYRWIWGSAVFSTWFFLGMTITSIQYELNDTDHFSNYLDENQSSYVIARVISPVLTKANSYKTELEIEQVISDSASYECKGKVLLYAPLSDSLRYGDKYLIHSRFLRVTPPQNPNEFNYKKYLSFHNIFHQCFLNKNNYQQYLGNEGNIILSSLLDLRKRIFHSFSVHGIIGNELKVLSALLLGEKNYLDQEIIQAYSSAGALHVLAVSGLHVGIIYLVFSFLFSVLFKRLPYYRIITVIAIIFLLWTYALFTGLSPSVNRAVTMFSFIAFGKLLQRNINIYNLICASAFILLVFNPFLITEVGFQLSYLAVTGIIYLYPKVYTLLYVPNYFFNKLWALSCVSFSAQLVTFPLGLLYFHQFPNYFFISNLFVIPLATIIMYAGFICLVTYLLPFSIISDLCTIILHSLLRFLNYVVIQVEQLPYSITNNISISISETFMIYGGMLTIMVYLSTKKKLFLMLSVSLLFLLICTQLFDKYTSLQQQKLIVYNINNHAAIDLISGNSNLLIYSDSLINNSSKMQFHIAHNWMELNVSEHAQVCLDSISGDYSTKQIEVYKNYCLIGNNKIFIFSDTNSLEQNPFGDAQIDYMIVSNNMYQEIEKALEIIKPEFVIFDSSNKIYANHLKSILSTKKIAYFNVNTEGAYVMNLTN